MRDVVIAASLVALATGATAPTAAAEPFIEAQRAPPVFVIGPSTVPARARTTHARRAARELPPREALAAANRAARRRPGSGFVGAAHFYAYEPGAIFELHASPAYVSTVMLEPGEALVDAAAGDTENWSVATTLSGTGAEARTLVMVKPKAASLRTNLVLVTDRRTYLVEAMSSAGESYSAQIAWRYPQASVPRAAERANAAAPIAYNHSYRIRVVRGRRPAWAPVRL